MAPAIQQQGDVMSLTVLKATITLAAFAWIATSEAYASTVEQLILDDTAGNSASIDVDDLGFTSCSGTGTGCGGLTIPASITPHSTLLVFGALGQFTLQVTGVGGASALYPNLQNLTQISAASLTTGTLNAFFTDTDYCLGGGGCFGDIFNVSMTNNPDTAIVGSSTTFAVQMDKFNGVPAGTLVSF